MREVLSAKVNAYENYMDFIEMIHNSLLNIAFPSNIPIICLRELHF